MTYTVLAVTLNHAQSMNQLIIVKWVVTPGRSARKSLAGVFDKPVVLFSVHH